MDPRLVYGRRSCTFLGVFCLIILVFVSYPFSARADDFYCPKEKPKVPDVKRSDVYKDVPFSAGESSVYEVTWGGILAGNGTIEVRSPRKYNNVWHRVYSVNARTGDWFKVWFVAQEKVEALSRSWDFGVSRFFMQQQEGKLFSKQFIQKKWLEFDHDDCKVHEKIKKPGKDAKEQVFPLSYGAVDALGAVFYLRTMDYTFDKNGVGEKKKFLVYTSEKNWWLEAQPIATESVEVPAGKFDTTKLKLRTFLGKDLQQKGDVFIWIENGGNRRMVQVQGEIKIGSVWIKLKEYKSS